MIWYDITPSASSSELAKQSKQNLHGGSSSSSSRRRGEEASTASSPAAERRWQGRRQRLRRLEGVPADPGDGAERLPGVRRHREEPGELPHRRGRGEQCRRRQGRVGVDGHLLPHPARRRIHCRLLLGSSHHNPPLPLHLHHGTFFFKKSIVQTRFFINVKTESLKRFFLVFNVKISRTPLFNFHYSDTFMNEMLFKKDLDNKQKHLKYDNREFRN